jgi:protein tyrosine/serine phosphatase
LGKKRFGLVLPGRISKNLQSMRYAMMIHDHSPLGSRNSVFKRALAMSAAFALALLLTGVSNAAFDGKKDKRKADEESDVKNFGRVNDHIYRGGQPKDGEYKELVSLGIKTIIDLREDAENYARRSAEQAGLQYINIRLNAKRPPTEAESSQFLSAVNDQANWPVFVHCAGGKHRTGVLIAVYRMEMDGWNARRAYEEMKDFKFYSSSGHGDMKEYVFDYYNRMLAKRVAEPAHASRPRTVIGSGPEK